MSRVFLVVMVALAVVVVGSILATILSVFFYHANAAVGSMDGAGRDGTRAECVVAVQRLAVETANTGGCRQP